MTKKLVGTMLLIGLLVITAIIALRKLMQRFSNFNLGMLNPLADAMREKTSPQEATVLVDHTSDKAPHKKYLVIECAEGANAFEKHHIKFENVKYFIRYSSDYEKLKARLLEIMKAAQDTNNTITAHVYVWKNSVHPELSYLEKLLNEINLSFQEI